MLKHRLNSCFIHALRHKARIKHALRSCKARLRKKQKKMSVKACFKGLYNVCNHASMLYHVKNAFKFRALIHAFTDFFFEACFTW